MNNNTEEEQINNLLQNGFLNQLEKALKRIGKTKEELMQECNVSSEEFYRIAFLTKQAIDCIEQEFDKDE